MSPQSTLRPRPGPTTIVAVVIGGAALVALGFVVTAIAGQEMAAGTLGGVILIGFLLIHISPLSSYLSRHLGSRPITHIIMAFWAIGMGLVLAGTNDVATDLALTISLLAVGTTGLEYIIWARYPLELAASHLPGIRDVIGEFRWFDRTSQPFVMIDRALMWLAWLSALLASIGLATSFETLFVFPLAIWSAAYLLAVALAFGSGYRRVVSGDNHLRPVLAAALSDYDPEVLFHFSGSINARYQLDQWMPSIVNNGLRTLLVLREETTHNSLQDAYDIPSVFIRDFSDLDLVVTDSTAAALYVNTGTKNNHLARFTGLTHIQLHHGDSDKPPSSGKPMRLYDLHFVAGEAAVDRMTKAGIADPDSIVVIGRPVTDPLADSRPPGDREVLYAPTWEGFHIDSALSSIGPLAEAIVAGMPDDVSLTIRPHPLTGTSDRMMRAQLARLRDLARTDGATVRYVEPGADDSLTDLMSKADVLIGDISSVLVDFLATGRPALVTDVQGLGTSLATRYPSTAWCGRIDPQAGNLVELIDDALGADVRAEHRNEMQSRMLSYVGHATTRFKNVLADVVSGDFISVPEKSPDRDAPPHS